MNSMLEKNICKFKRWRDDNNKTFCKYIKGEPLV